MKSRRQWRGSMPSPCESGHISVLTTQEVPLPFPDSSLPLSEECVWFGRRELSTSWVGVLVSKCHLYAPDSYFPCWCSLPILHWCNPIRIKENQLRVPHSLATVSFKADASLLRWLKSPRTLKKCWGHIVPTHSLSQHNKKHREERVQTISTWCRSFLPSPARPSFSQGAATLCLYSLRWHGGSFTLQQTLSGGAWWVDLSWLTRYLPSRDPREPCLHIRIILSFFPASYLKKIEIVVYSHKIVRTNTERAYGLFCLPRPPTVVPFWRTIVQYYNQDLDIDTEMLQKTHLSPPGSLCVPFYNYTQLPSTPVSS